MFRNWQNINELFVLHKKKAFLKLKPDDDLMIIKEEEAHSGKLLQKENG